MLNPSLTFCKGSLTVKWEQIDCKSRECCEIHCNIHSISQQSLDLHAVNKIDEPMGADF